ncbi:hypothetical protein FHR70_000727 [Microvirga lupini]|uniref:Uncharacterized protein n=1 Tax=Microvirga lupini TaxID=420324 RepID=A0A7W4VJD2_9HYPH|nr:hypothetical protein [Microvirga lupini]MBB3017687.1 hypothetical protein [Microvirga lupini]
MSIIEQIAGRLFAIEMLRSVDGMPKSMFADGGGLDTVARNLEATAARYPADYAAGIRQVTGQVLAKLAAGGGK